MKRSHILVVDDDSSLRRVMQMQLEEAGYEVSLAADGSEAWNRLKSVEPHLVITDLRMPTTGLELLRRITADRLTYGTPADHRQRLAALRIQAA